MGAGVLNPRGCNIISNNHLHKIINSESDIINTLSNPERKINLFTDHLQHQRTTRALQNSPWDIFFCYT